MKTTKSGIALSIGIAAVTALTGASSAYAVVGVNASATASVTTGANVAASTTVNTKVEARAAAKQVKVAAAVSKAIVRADQEISRRIASLNTLSTRINSMKKVSANDKSALTANVQTQISTLTALQAKIDADTNAAILKTDVKSITDSYRIYALVIPQGELYAAVDSVGTTADSLNALGAKLQTRVIAAQTAGKDVSSLNASLSDFSAKIADAQVQASSSEAEISVLAPDQGDKTKMTANTSALKDARAKVKTASDDLKTARKDAQSIVDGLKKLEGKGTATTTVSASSTVTQ